MSAPEKAGKKTSDLNIFAFWKAQQHTWKTTVIRTSLERLGYKMVLPYLSLYIILLGANKSQLGLVTSVGLICTALLSPVVGQLIDRMGPKRIYIVGIGILIAGYIAFGSAHVWQVAALGVFLHQIGQGIGGASCASICGNCLANCDRAKGMLVCESLAAGLLGMVGPVISGWILVKIMGVEGKPTDPAAIRPLFFITMALTAVSLLVVIFRLPDLKWSTGTRKKRNVLKDAGAILRSDKNCVKWLFCAAVGAMPVPMIVPYLTLFASEYRGASVADMAAMTTAASFIGLAFGYVFGILSDRYGRKKVFLTAVGLYLAGLVLLLVSPGRNLLVVVGLLAGFQEINAPLAGSIQNELVPKSIMGRWQGVVRLFSSLWSAALAAVAGIIYENLGGQWVFLIYIACEVLIRFPLILSLPETLNYRVDESKFAALMD